VRQHEVRQAELPFAYSLLSHAQPSDVFPQKSSEVESNDEVDKENAEVDARIAELIRENTVLQKVRPFNHWSCNSGP